MLASDPTIVDALITASGARLRRKLPGLEKQLRVQRAALAQVAADASTLLTRTSDAAFESGKALIADQLRDLTLQRDELDEAVRATEMQVEGSTRRRGGRRYRPLRARPLRPGLRPSQAVRAAGADPPCRSGH